MEKLKQYRLLKKIKKMLDAPARPEEGYDASGISTAMFIGASTPRSASHFANGTVSFRQNQVKEIAARMLELIDLLEKGGNEPGPVFVDLHVRFQELDLSLLFTDQERAERAALTRKKKTAPLCIDSTVPKLMDLEGVRARIAQWMKEQLERKRRLYKIETMVRDLGVNVNDVRCRGLETDRRVALARLNESTDVGVRMLRDLMGKLEEVAAARGQ
jgi:hypothetical protein